MTVLQFKPNVYIYIGCIPCVEYHPDSVPTVGGPVLNFDDGHIRVMFPKHVSEEDAKKLGQEILDWSRSNEKKKISEHRKTE